MQRSRDLEMYRDRFLGELHQAKPELRSQDAFVKYWKLVESEAQRTEELQKLDIWVRDLARDRDKVRSLKGRLETAGADPQAQSLLAMVKRILDMLDATEKKLKRRFDARKGVLAFLLFRAGPGVKKKGVPQEPGPNPKKPGKGQGPGKKEDDDVSEVILTQQPVAPKPTPKPPQKKMER